MKMQLCAAQLMNADVPGLDSLVFAYSAPSLSSTRPPPFLLLLFTSSFRQGVRTDWPCIMNVAEVLMLDEPTGHLDVDNIKCLGQGPRTRKTHCSTITMMLMLVMTTMMLAASDGDDDDDDDADDGGDNHDDNDAADGGGNHGDGDHATDHDSNDDNNDDDGASDDGSEDNDNDDVNGDANEDNDVNNDYVFRESAFRMGLHSLGPLGLWLP